MGSYSNLKIDGYHLFDNKNSYFIDVTETIFLPSDFVVEERTDSDNSKYIFKGYKQTVKACRKRLEIYGASLKKAKKDFQVAKSSANRDKFYSFPILKVTYEEYLAELKSIIENKEYEYKEFLTNLHDSLIVGELGISQFNLKSHLYSIFSVVDENAIIEYDLSDIIQGGYTSEDDVKNINPEKIIILTEGKSDVDFLKASLSKLYPYLAEYYHFMNFDEYKVESNASALVKLVISLAASNIKHPIIVIFDNDTAGIMEMKKLQNIYLPDNFKILKYPNLVSLKKYPTIGPTGNKKMNINGLASSIEMYFGVDILSHYGTLVPIQWKGFNEKENKYQGEVRNKALIQEKFREKLKRDSENGFEDIKLILEEIFKAFQ